MIKIDVNNRHKDYEYEYSKTVLTDFESKYIYIPMSVITDVTLDIKRVCIFSYLRIHNGLNDLIGFTVPDMVQWCGNKSDRKINGTNDKFLSVIDSLSDKGYITYLTEKSRSSYIKCEFNSKYYGEECSNGYSVIYLDELKKIIDYKKENLKDGFLSNAAILLVFSYLRNKIKRRPNRLNPEEMSLNGIKERKKRYPEAYNSNINEISSEIGISSKTLSKIIDILEYNLKLIVTDRPYRIKDNDNKFITPPSIFANSLFSMAS